MILKGSQRGGGAQLAVHLMRLDENDHVEVHDVRGFVSNDLSGALKEAYAISRGTRCRQFLFSLSLSPPSKEHVPVDVFEKAIAEIEDRMGLSGQPRVIVFHEKEGRRHAHAVWSRIKADEMKAINLPHYKLKLRDASRQLYIEHGWQMPRGLVNSEERDPLNFSREEWQQAKRIGRDPRAIKEIFQDCWAISDGLKAFRNAMEARGYYLAQGDRRGFVALDWRGEVYAISRWTGVRTKEVRAKLGDPADLPSVERVKTTIAAKVTDKVRRFTEDIRLEFETARHGLVEKRKKLVTWQRHERKLLSELQAVRWVQESLARAERFRKGVKGLWDRLTGRHAETRRKNETDVAHAEARDGAERQALIERQLDERSALQRQIKAQQDRKERDIMEIESGHVNASPEIQPNSKLRVTRSEGRKRRRHTPEP